VLPRGGARAARRPRPWRPTSSVNVAAASTLLDHPRTVYLREADLLPHLDGWRIGLFDPTVLDTTLDALIAASQNASGAAEPSRKVERTLADCRYKLAPLTSGAGRQGYDQRCVSAAHGTSRERSTERQEST
jgi:hypothetical protein